MSIESVASTEALNLKRCELVGLTVSCLLSTAYGLLPNDLNRELAELGHRLILERVAPMSRHTLIQQLKKVYSDE